MNCINRLFLASQLLVISFNGQAQEGQTQNSATIHAGLFSQEKLETVTPTGWSPLHFPSIEQKSAYFLARDNGQTIIKAVSHGGASGFFRKIDIDTRQYPILSWHWKVNNILQKGDVMTKQGDDYPARIYVSFEYDASKLTGMDKVRYKLYTMLHDKPPPLAVINYVWGNKASVGTIVSNAYSPRVKMIVVESGAENVNKWMSVQRNLYDDYVKAFGEMPDNVSGIAIMTDTDNTGESAVAYYGDITFSRNHVAMNMNSQTGVTPPE